MAYRSRRRSTARRPSRSRASAPRRGSARRYGTGSRRATRSYGRSRGASTLRIEVVQASPSAARPEMLGLRPADPPRSKPTF